MVFLVRFVVLGLGSYAISFIFICGKEVSE